MGGANKTIVYFNPRLHEGDDKTKTARTSISDNFNPRLHEGDDFPPQLPPQASKKFQSTSPRRRRRRCLPVLSGRQNFNPRLHEGDDGVVLSAERAILVFQSTSPRRRRLLQRFYWKIAGRFQSTSPRRRRPL